MNKRTSRLAANLPLILTLIERLVANETDGEEFATLKALVIEEIRRLHEGVLAWYGLRPSQLTAWKQQHVLQ